MRHSSIQTFYKNALIKWKALSLTIFLVAIMVMVLKSDSVIVSRDGSSHNVDGLKTKRIALVLKFE
jgi:hypothetical protein